MSDSAALILAHGIFGGAVILAFALLGAAIVRR